LRSAEAWKEAKLNFRQPQAYPGRRHANVASHGQLKAAAKTGAVDRGDDGLVASLDPVEQSLPAGGEVGSCLRRGQERQFFDVGAGAEEAARAGEDHDADAGVGLQPRTEFIHFSDDCGTEDIGGRVVQGDRGNPVSHGDGHVPVLAVRFLLFGDWAHETPGERSAPCCIVTNFRPAAPSWARVSCRRRRPSSHDCGPFG
jgi:hypothetical protein